MGANRESAINEAADKLRRLLNTNFKESDFEIKITYKGSIENGNKNRQQTIY